MPNRAAATAIGPMSIVAIEQYESRERRVLTDARAIEMLPRGVKALVAACAWRPMRRLMINGLNKQAPGMWESFLCRKRYLDDQVVGSLADGITQLVVLGAGMDTRGLRVAGPSATVFEVDLPENITEKRRGIRRIVGEVPAHLRLVACDFETGELATSLAAAGFRIDVPTFFIWEAVTQYLTEAGVRVVFEFLSTTAPGSGLAFTYVRKDFLDGDDYFGSQAMHRGFVVKKRLWHFGWQPAEVDAFLRGYGWREVEQLGATEYNDRFLTPTGRTTTVSEVERMVLAAIPDSSTISP